MKTVLFILSITFLSPFYAQNCQLYPGEDIGAGNIGAVKTTNAGDCCTACNNNPVCLSFTWESDGSNTCYLKDNTSGNGTKSTVTSGFRSAALDSPVTLQTDKVINVVDELYRSVTVDTTNNRQFFDVNWSDPNIMYLMKALGPMYVRVGGSGEGQDGLFFNGTNCTNQYSCIDEPRFDAIYNIIVKNGGSRMVWGLPYTKYPNSSLDYSHGQEDLMKYAAGQGYIIYGFELGNEDQNQVDDHPDLYAQDFGTLANLAKKYWPDASVTPKMYGPDDQLGPNWGLQEFLMQVIQQKIPMVGITSHEYYGMNNEAYLDPSRLDSNFHTADNWTKTLDQYFGTNRQIQMWAGEIGPSIGGSGNCSEEYYRFNGFADGFWYLDSLGAHAQEGYQVFARQDFYGIDYALLDCTYITPVPDYYSAIIWKLVMGEKVFNTTRPGKGLLRPYTHCSKQYPGALAVLLINIWQGDANVKLSLTSGSLGNTREDYLLTTPGNPLAAYPAGMYGKGIQLNGVTLTYTVGGQLPPIKPAQSKATDQSVITMPEYSYGFFVFPDSSVSACK